MDDVDSPALIPNFYRMARTCAVASCSFPSLLITAVMGNPNRLASVGAGAFLLSVFFASSFIFAFRFVIS